MGVEQKISEYKTFEELKEELGDKFEDYMYKANIELLNKLQQKENIIKEVREKIKNHLYAKTILSDMYSDNEIFEFILEKIGDIDE